MTRAAQLLSDGRVFLLTKLSHKHSKEAQLQRSTKWDVEALPLEQCRNKAKLLFFR